MNINGKELDTANKVLRHAFKELQPITAQKVAAFHAEAKNIRKRKEIRELIKELEKLSSTKNGQGLHGLHSGASS